MILAVIIPVVLFSMISPYNREYKMIAWFAYILFAFFFCIRGEIATDWHAYKMYFDNVFNDVIIDQSGFEIGFIMLCKIFKWFGCSYWIFNTCFSLVIVFIIYKAINIYTDNIGLALLLAMLYFFYPSLEALRQMMVITLFFYSLQFLEDNAKKYLIINVIAVLFHKTALIAWIFFVLYKYKRTRKLFAIAMIAVSILQPLLEKVLAFFPALYQKYKWYVMFVGGVEDYSYIFSFKTAEYIAVIAILIYLRKKQLQLEMTSETQGRYDKLVDREPMENMVVLLLGMGLLFHLGLGSIMDSTYRLLYYSDIGIILGVCFIYDRLKYELQRSAFIITVNLYVILKFISIINAHPDLFRL